MDHEPRRATIPHTLVSASPCLPATIDVNAGLPAAFFPPGSRTYERTAEFFAARIRNPNTRAAYLHAIRRFVAWCDVHGIVSLPAVTPLTVAAYIETHPGSPTTVKQHLAALRMLFDYLVTGQVIASNPAHPVRGPRHSTARGKTPVLDTDQARAFFASIRTDSIAGLRDRALVGVMVYSFARIGAVTRMRVKDYFPDGKRWWLRLHEKGGKHHRVPVHHKAEEYLDAYLDAAGLAADPNGFLFRTIDRVTKSLGDRPFSRNDALRMIKRRASAAGLPSDAICCHTWRATGITAYLENGGQLEHAAEIAAHASIRTTKLYDRRTDLANLDEIERIAI